MLREDDRVELICGGLIDMAAIGNFHAGVVDQLAEHFIRSASRFIVRVQNPLPLPPDSVSQPDLLLLRPTADFYKSEAPQPSDVLLVLEVSDSTLAYDRDIKLPLYARPGIPEAWIVNIADRSLEIHREPEPQGYRVRYILRPGDVAVPTECPEAGLAVASLF